MSSIDQFARGWSGPGVVPAYPRLTTALVVLSLVLLFGVSDMRLAVWGFAYDTPGGSPIEKVHPGSWVAFLALGVLMLGHGNPLAYGDRLVAERGPTLAFIAGLGVILFHLVMVIGQPWTGLIDTYLLTVALFLLLVEDDETRRRVGAATIHVMLALNGIIAIVEVVAGLRVTPFVIQGIELTWEWRATALLGHPLFNATITGAYIIILLLGGSRTLPPLLVVPAIGLQVAALMMFGGRTATVLVVLFALLVAACGAARVLAGGRFSLGAAIAAAFAMPFGFAALYALVQTPFFERFADRFVADDGSADARLRMFDVMAQIPLRELLLAPDIETVETIRRVEGLVGIESFFVATIVYWGLAAALVLFVALAMFLWDVVRGFGPRAFPVIAYFFILASTSVSIAGKSPALALVVAMMGTMLPRSRRAR